MPGSRSAAAVKYEVQSADLRSLYVKLKGTEGNLRVVLRRRLSTAAQPAVDAVKAAASFSSRIPGATKAKPSFSAKASQVAVIVDQKKAPEARVLENNGKDGTFRKPVFGRTDRNGHRVWADQKAQPFFGRAINRQAGAMNEEMSKILDDVAKQAGFN